jgi:3-mercaptopyruvate sulfurtransferase SseA
MKIRAEIKLLKESGVKVKDAVVIVGDKFHLSASRVWDIWYQKKCK